MRSYATARSLFGFLEFVFWSVAAIGVIGALAGAEEVSREYGAAAFMGALPGLAVMLFGLLGVANIQHARAGVDSAEYSQQMLKIARDQLEVSKQALMGDAPQKASFAASKSHGLSATPSSQTARTEPPIAARPAGNAAVPASDIYHGNQRIRQSDGLYVCDDGQRFTSLEDAKAHVALRHDQAK